MVRPFLAPNSALFSFFTHLSIASWEIILSFESYIWKSNILLVREQTAVAKLLQLSSTLCDPIDGSPPGSTVPGILQARTLEWVAISFSNAWKWKVKVKSLSSVWLSHPMDCSLSGSSIHGIFQARVVEWGAIAFSIVNRLGGCKKETPRYSSLSKIDYVVLPGKPGEAF